MTDALTPREEVWVVLSDLFLDTDMSNRLDYPARKLAASPFDLDELEQILLEDVYPVCGWNLYATAGAWTGFDPQELIACIKSRTERRHPLLWMWMPFRKQAMRWGLPEWQDVRHRIEALRR